jgi:hypothetical protein
MPLTLGHALGEWPDRRRQPQAIGGRGWKEPSNPITTTTSTPSRTKRHTSKPTTIGQGSPSTLPPSAASSAANSRSRSQEDSSRRSTWSGIPTPRHSRQCGSATNALLGWRRYSPRNPLELSGCETGRSGHVAAVPPTCPNHRSAAVIHGQPRSMPMPAELWHRPVRSGPRELPKLAVKVRFPSSAPTHRSMLRGDELARYASRRDSAWKSARSLAASAAP